MTSPFSRWFTLPQEHDTDTPFQRVESFRSALKAGHAETRARFQAGDDAAELVAALSWLVDQLLIQAWRKYITQDMHLALVAVGGYGRRELLPGSDIDLMILLPETGDDAAHTEDLQQFLAFLWDIGLEVGHSVRSIHDCVEQATQDVTVITNLIEARFLIGDNGLFNTMRDAIAPENIWSSKAFFEAKLKEQKQRHRKFHDTGYKLEPNIKESPGGLRDIQMIGWVAKRHFGEKRLAELVTHKFLTEREYAALMRGQTFLWRVRFALHFHTGRREDRLLFDYQRPLAEQLGYKDSPHQMAVELFMREYYRTVQQLNRLNDVMLQLFREAILHANDSAIPVPINKRFQARKGFLEAVDDSVFRRFPFALLEVFLVLQQHPELKGVRAATIRHIRSHLHLIDDDFRKDLRARSLFMEIFRQPQGLTHVLRKMNSYGVLAAYIPAFASIVGQMQYDLFHIYTVDEHTLSLIRNQRRFTVPEFADEFPLCSEISATLPKPELLYLGGLFHDIAKGRGGSHSELGAEDAYTFCQAHNLSEHDSQFVSWLVRSHLTMSTTAQRKDISDPAVILEFAELMGDVSHLDYLYLLTVADIRATNPELWNSWKDSLLRQLYMETKQALQRGLSDPLGVNEQVSDTKSDALKMLLANQIDQHAVEQLWSRLDNEYFLRHSPEEISWHTQAILENTADHGDVVTLRALPEHGGTELFIYTPSKTSLFSMTTALLDQMGLTIMDARIVTSSDHYALNTYVILEQTGKLIGSGYRSQEIRAKLLKNLHAETAVSPRVTRRAPRRHQHFSTKTQVRFLLDEHWDKTMVEIITTDRPGLLLEIGRVFQQLNISLENARIGTFGNRAEDVFYVVNDEGTALTSEQQSALKKSLLEELETAST